MINLFFSISLVCDALLGFFFFFQHKFVCIASFCLNAFFSFFFFLLMINLISFASFWFIVLYFGSKTM